MQRNISLVGSFRPLDNNFTLQKIDVKPLNLMD